MVPTTVPQDLSITNWIVKCHQKGFLLGPFQDELLPYDVVYTSPLFTVSKPDFKRRVVCNLSHPKFNGVSVNDCIDPAAKAVQYISFVELCLFVYELGYDARLWIVDAQDAYYRVPIKEKYWKYMGIRWYGYVFLFTSLQMGLGSACAIYQAFADAVMYIIIHNHKHKNRKLFIDDIFIYIRHYLDDFFGGHSDPDVAKEQVLQVEFIFALLGIPTQRRKLRFPHWKQIILGWLFNTRLRTVSVPEDKVIIYCNKITIFIRERCSGTGKKEMEQLKGALQWAAPVVYPGKTRLRNLDYAMHLELYNYTDKIYANDLIIDDLKWFRRALKHANGVPLTWIIKDPHEFDDMAWVDAATTVGAGGCTRSGYAYQYLNRDTFYEIVKIFRNGIDIKLLEYIAIYVIAYLMRENWKFKNVKLFSDNPVVVSSLINQRAPLGRRDLHYLTVKFADLSAQYHFRFWVANIDGDDNDLADDLSRFKSQYRNNNLKFDDYKFVNANEAIDVANEIFMDLLNPKIVPLNKGDSEHLVLDSFL